MARGQHNLLLMIFHINCGFRIKLPCFYCEFIFVIDFSLYKTNSKDFYKVGYFWSCWNWGLVLNLGTFVSFFNSTFELRIVWAHCSIIIMKKFIWNYSNLTSLETLCHHYLKPNTFFHLFHRNLSATTFVVNFTKKSI